MANMTDKGVKTSREKVFEIINSERVYQELRWGYRQSDGSFKECDKSLNDFLVYMQHYLTKTIEEASTKAGNEPALDMLRKVITLGVACLESHGASPRDVNNVINARDGQLAS